MGACAEQAELVAEAQAKLAKEQAKRDAELERCDEHVQDMPGRERCRRGGRARLPKEVREKEVEEEVAEPRKAKAAAGSQSRLGGQSGTANPNLRLR